MIDPGVVQELYRYNRWANVRAFEAVAPLTQDAFAGDLGSSHSSVRDTLTHIVWAEWLYLRRWQGTSPQTVFRARDFPHPDDLRARWSEIEAEQRAFVASLTAERLLADVRYLNLKGESWEYVLWRQMYHVVNHSSYHRGQLTTLLRQLGATPNPSDFLLFHDDLDAGVA
jgi:uncharacterized damage-inducible protein DinB